MPTTQMPPKTPPAPPPQADLYNPQWWESAYGDFSSHDTPTLLVQLQDDLSRSRLREALWISVVVHLLVVIAIVNFSWFDRWFPHHVAVVVAPFDIHQKELTYLELPPDEQKLTKRTDSNIISDKDRIATSRTPRVDPEELRRIIDSSRPGPPGPSGAPGANVPPPAGVQNAPPQQAQNPPANTNQTAKLQAPPLDPKVAFGGSMSAGSAVEQAARAAAANRGGYGGAGGDFGLGTGQRGRVMGNLDVLSDTMGVDFGPYLQRVLHNVKMNWYNIIPEAASWKKGKVSIEFAILKDGRVAGMRLMSSSGDVALDRPAWGAITASNPFPPLPSEFGGQYLALRFHFYYNPDRTDLE